MSYFSSPSVDHGIAGLGAGVASTIAMQPLDLIKVRLQVSERSKQKDIWKSLLNRQEWKGMWRGLTTNIVGNSISWGGYFWLYTKVKNRLHDRHPNRKLSAVEHLYAASEAGSIVAITTNPLWLIKTRIFTTKRNDKGAYRGLIHGMIDIGKKEGIPGYWRGTLLALFGVLQGAIQFAVYEELKLYRAESSGNVNENLPWLSNWEYTLMSGVSKLVALGMTYPYQVVRSRIQNEKTYTTIRQCVISTFKNDGLLAFYQGAGINALRILPGTCVTFVVYENISRILQTRSRILTS